MANLATKMADTGGEFFLALEEHLGKIDIALNSKCNMNQTVRESAKAALFDLKSLIEKNITLEHHGDCGRGDSGSDGASLKALFTKLQEEFTSFKSDISTKIDAISTHISPDRTSTSAKTSGPSRVDDLPLDAYAAVAARNLKASVVRSVVEPPLRVSTLPVNQKNTRPKIVVNGTLKNTNLKIVEKLPKRKAVFLSRLDPTISAKDITDFLSPINLDFLICNKLVTKYNTYSSFHIEVYENDLEKLLCSSVWPEGCLVSQFYGRLKSTQILVPENIPENTAGQVSNSLDGPEDD